MYGDALALSFTHSPTEKHHKSPTMRSALLLCAFMPLCMAATTWRELAKRPEYSFEDYVLEFDKVYSPEESADRSAIFATQLAKIRAHNAGDHSWKMGLNAFSDWTESEIRARRTGGLPPVQEFTSMHSLTGKAIPASVDWRTKQVVTNVKDQGGCGSCWAFSATETIESATAIATGQLLELSPQQLVSCAPNDQHCGGTGGCGGSTMKLAFNYTEKHGLSKESSYPYRGITGSCDAAKIDSAVSIKGYVGVQMNNYTALMDAIANVGPVSVMVAAGFSSYEEGVYSGNCGWTVDHGVQLVGYGFDEEANKDYWLVRNSWGKSWGEAGYVRIHRFGEANEPCGEDLKPQDGVACEGQKLPIKYCGLCAMFCSPSYPIGAELVQ